MKIVHPKSVVYSTWMKTTVRIIMRRKIKIEIKKQHKLKEGTIQGKVFHNYSTSVCIFKNILAHKMIICRISLFLSKIGLGIIRNWYEKAISSEKWGNLTIHYRAWSSIDWVRRFLNMITMTVGGQLQTLIPILKVVNPRLLRSNRKLFQAS